MTLAELISALTAIREVYGGGIPVGYGEGFDYIDEFVPLTEIRIGREYDRAPRQPDSRQGQTVLWLH